MTKILGLILLISIGATSASPVRRVLSGISKRTTQHAPCHQVVQGLLAILQMAPSSVPSATLVDQLQAVSTAVGFDVLNAENLQQRICPLHGLETLSELKIYLHYTGLLGLVNKIAYDAVAILVSRFRNAAGDSLTDHLSLRSLQKYEAVSAFEAAGLGNLDPDADDTLGLLSLALVDIGPLWLDMENYEPEPESTGPVVAKAYRLARAITNVVLGSFHEGDTERLNQFLQTLQEWTGFEIDMQQFSNLHSIVISVLEATDGNGLDGLYLFNYYQTLDHTLSTGYPLFVQQLSQLEMYVSARPPNYNYPGNDSGPPGTPSSNDNRPAGNHPSNAVNDLLLDIITGLRDMNLLDLRDDLQV